MKTQAHVLADIKESIVKSAMLSNGMNCTNLILITRPEC
jgi:hypothetical protein